jgi:hypothetical protein
MTAKCRSVYPKSHSKEDVEVVGHNRPKPRKIKREAVFPIIFALAAIILAPRAGAQSQDGRGEGPIEIEKCRTIDKPGSYKLVNNLTSTGPNDTCLSITASFVTVDLAGFTITGPCSVGLCLSGGSAIAGVGQEGIAVRNGSILGFSTGVRLGDLSVVEGLRVNSAASAFGIVANGIVRGNTVVALSDHAGIGISASGIVTGNFVSGGATAIQIGQGSTVIGNTANGTFPSRFGIAVDCPSNVTDNTAVNYETNLVLGGDGCTNTNNVAP